MKKTKERILEVFESSLSAKEAAEKFGLSQSYVYNIRAGHRGVWHTGMRYFKPNIYKSPKSKAQGAASRVPVTPTDPEQPVRVRLNQVLQEYLS